MSVQAELPQQRAPQPMIPPVQIQTTPPNPITSVAPQIAPPRQGQQSIFTSEMLLGPAVKHSILGNPLNRTSNDYQLNMKSMFLQSKLFEEGKQKPEFTGKAAEDYAKQMITTAESRKLVQPLIMPTVAESKIDIGSHYTGSMRQKKKGFCGSSIINTPLDLYVDDKGELIMKPVNDKKDSGKAKEPGHFKGEFTNIKVVDLDTILSQQNTPEGKKKLADHLEQVVVPPQGNFKYLLAFEKPGSKEGEAERSYFYFKDDDDLERFRNTVMGTSAFGKNFLHDTNSQGGAGNLPLFILRRRAFIAEMLLKCIDDTHEKGRFKIEDQLRRDKEQKDKEERDRLNRIQSEEQFKRQREKEEEEARRKPKSSLTQHQKVEILRRVAIKSLMKRELNNHLSHHDKVKKCVEKMLRNQGGRQSSRMMRSWFMRWVLNDRDLRELNVASSVGEIVVTPRKYYNLYPDTESRDDLRTQHLSVLHIIISQTKVTDEDIAGTDYRDDHKIIVDILPIPTGSGVQTTEYSVMSAQGSIDLSKFVGQYLTTYVKNKEVREVVCVGHVKISKQMQQVIKIEMFKNKNRYPENMEKYPIGSVIFKRENISFPTEVEPSIENLIQPCNFGYMKKFHSTLVNDMGLGGISGPDGAGKRYYHIQQYLASEYSFCAAVSRYESDLYRQSEWSFFERTVIESNKSYIARIQGANQAQSTIVSNSEGLRQVMAPITTKQYPRGVENHEKSFLFFSRDHWRDAIEFTNPKIREIHDKALMTGMPFYLYLPVWKSLGKSPVVTQIIVNLCRAKLPNFDETSSLLLQLSDAGKDELYHNPNVNKDLALMDKQYIFEPEEYRLIKKVLCAFLKLSMIMEDVSDENDLTGPLLKGFSLKCVGGLVFIVKHLANLRILSQKNKEKDPRCATVTDDDVFIVLMSMAFVFLPEHFLNPLYKFEPTQESKAFYTSMKKFGIDFERLQRNKMFVTSAAIGSYKLSLILAQCIKKDAKDIYEKMTDLGFPFLTYCLELSESMFSEHLNPDVLSRLWNVTFFEGADTYKRRAQQIILSALMVTIKNCRKQILNSRSSQEIKWHLKAQGEFNFEGTQFICDLFKTRKTYFITETTGPGLFSKIGSLFNSGGQSVEVEFQEVKGKIADDFEVVSKTNYEFLKYLISITDKIKSEGRKLDIAHLKRFLEAMVVGLNPDQNRIKLSFENNLAQQAYILAEKPQPLTITFNICSWDFGNYLPENLSLTAKSNFKNHAFVMRNTDANWYRTHTFDASMVQSVNQSWIDLEISGIDRMSKVFKSSKRFTLDRFRFNKASYFTFKYYTFWIVVCFKMTGADIKTDEVDYFKNLDHDVQHRNSIFCEELADHMDITRETPYREELLNNTCDKVHLHFIIEYAYGVSDANFTDDVVKYVMKTDLLGKGIPNLFETLVRIILFSPTDNITIIRQLFTLLARLDLSPDPNKVKRTHVEFLVWYVLRVTQIYLPYVEIVSTVSTILHESDSNIISAVISNIEESRKPSLDITELLNLWFIAQRRRTGSSAIVLGNQGKLTNLLKAVNYWQTEHNQAAYKFTKMNKLRVFINSNGETRKIEVKFDQDMNIVMDKKDRDFRVDSTFVLLLEDSEESLNFSQFSQVMTQFQILDWIFSRLTGIGADNISAKRNRDPTTSSIMPDPTLSTEVVVKFRYHEDTSNNDLALIHLKKMSTLRLLDYKRDHKKVDYLVDNRRKITFANSIPIIKELTIIESELTIRSMVEECLDEVKSDIIRVIDTNSYNYKYKEHTLDLLSASFDNMTIVVEGRALNPEYYDSPLKTILEKMNNPTKIHLLVEIKKDDIRPLYNHMAKDIYYLEGVEVVDNPFVPCQIMGKNSKFADVIFRNDVGKLMLLRNQKRCPG